MALPSRCGHRRKHILEELKVLLTLQLAEEIATSGGNLCARCVEQRQRGGAVTVRQNLDQARQPFNKHLAVANVPEARPEPAELFTELVRPCAIEQRRERLQVAAQAAQRDAQLAQGVR